jgi:hypothetical protein
MGLSSPHSQEHQGPLEVTMKAIINGRIYNTDTADVVWDVSYGWSGSDLDWHETVLYRTKKGTFFLAGKGGPRSMWAQHMPTQAPAAAVFA